MIRPLKIMMLFSLWGCLLVLGSCLQPKSGLRAVDHGEVFNLPGFSITPPTGPGWSLTSRNSRQITFTRETSAGKFHTVMAFAELEIRSKDLEDLAALQGELLSSREYSESRYRTLDRQVALDRQQGQEILRVNFMAEDRGVPYAPGKVFVLTGQDLYLPHPDHPRWLLIKCSYSQRYLQGTAPLPVEREFESFLKTVAFTPVSNPERLRKPTLSQQAWLIKIDPRGEILWQRKYQGLYVKALAASADGGCLLAGWSTYYSPSTQTVAQVVKIDSSGNPQWVKSFEGAGGKTALSLLPTPDGGYLIGGRSERGGF